MCVFTDIDDEIYSVPKKPREDTNPFKAWLNNLELAKEESEEPTPIDQLKDYNEENCIERIKKWTVLLSSFENKSINKYYKFGLDLALYKALIIKNCNNCDSNTCDINPFQVLSCKICCKNKNKFTTFKNTIENELQLNISHVNNVIDVAKICYVFPQFLKLNVTFSDLKKFKSIIKQSDGEVKSTLATKF